MLVNYIMQTVDFSLHIKGFVLPNFWLLLISNQRIENIFIGVRNWDQLVANLNPTTFYRFNFCKRYHEGFMYTTDYILGYELFKFAEVL